MIPKAEVLAVAEDAELLPTTVEQDYVLGWVRDNAGVEVPEEGIDVRESTNRRGERTFAARMTFVGPLVMPRAERQRIRFDLTRHELVVDPPEMCEVFHGYSDAPDPVPRVRCYSLAEVMAEKVRALHERSGRARDVYDVVNVGRNLKEEISAARVAEIADQKFRFKELDQPTPEGIFARVDPEVLETDWAQALRHQLPLLPPVHDFMDGLKEVLQWIFATTPSAHALSAAPGREGEQTVQPIRFARRGAARGVPHPRALPSSLRMARTGNLLLYVHEVQRGLAPGGGVKAFKVADLGEVQVTVQPFRTRYLVEL